MNNLDLKFINSKIKLRLITTSFLRICQDWPGIWIRKSGVKKGEEKTYSK